MPKAKPQISAKFGNNQQNSQTIVQDQKKSNVKRSQASKSKSPALAKRSPSKGKGMRLPVVSKSPAKNVNAKSANSKSPVKNSKDAKNSKGANNSKRSKGGAKSQSPKKSAQPAKSKKPAQTQQDVEMDGSAPTITYTGQPLKKPFTSYMMFCNGIRE